MNTGVGIIIINWNTRALLHACLTSVRNALHELSDVKAEIFVVDNASSDDSVAMVQAEFPEVHLICNDVNVGFARANNQGIQASTAEWLVLLNSDAQLSSSALQEMIACGKRKPQAGVVGCKLLNPDGSFQAAYNSFPTVVTTVLDAWGMTAVLTRNSYYPSAPPEQAQAARSCDWVGGACLMARRSAIDQVGLLDETFFMNSEELDWCYRMWYGGWQVWYVPEAEVVHVGGASADRRSARQRMRLYEGKARFVQKHYGGLAAFIVRMTFRVASLTKVVAYQTLYIATGNRTMKMQATSHWPVVWSRAWA